MKTPASIASLLDAEWLTRLATILLTPAWLVAIATIIIQIGGSALIIFGRQVWLGAGALGVFTALATLIGHPFWRIDDPIARFHERNTFLEHVGLIGGFIVVAVLFNRKERT